jgi:hypothetical protein
VLRKRGRATPPPPPPDPVGSLDLAQVPARLQQAVAQAVDAHRRWQQVVAAVSAGPVAERLGVLGGQVVAGVLEVHATALRIGEIDAVLAALDPDGATAAYKAARRAAADGRPPAELDALEARFASVQRIMNAVDDAEARLRVLDARLLAAVARAAEVALVADPTGLVAVGADLDGVVDELGALRGAMASLS